VTKKFVLLASIICIGGAPYSAQAKTKPEVSGLALQQIQARDYEVSKQVSFPAVMTVLQDAGYRISAADRDTGLITGSASTKSGLNYNFFFGFGKSKKTPIVSAFIEDRGVGSRVRLNFVMAKTKSSIYGMSSSDEEPISDPAAYRMAFEKIEKEIFVRQALVAPAPKPAPVVTQAAPAAAQINPAAVQPTSGTLTPNPPNMPSALNPDPK
jgi:hypothetical protein